MWSNCQDTSEHGEPILLFQPAGGSRERTRSRLRAKSSSSHIGGLPCYHEQDTRLPSIIGENGGFTNPRCTICEQQMYLIVQMHAPLDDLDRTLYVFGCNTFSCHSRGDNDKGEMGNDESESSNRFQSCKSVRCIRSQQCWTGLTALTGEAMTRDSEEPCNILRDNDWGVGDDNASWGDDGDNEWGGGKNNTSSGDYISIDDLELLLNSCEMKSPGRTSKPSPSTDIAAVQQSHRADSANRTNGTEPSFEYHDLETVNEPIVHRGGGDEDDDEDDVDCGNADATKVDEMLSRYLDMEDDEEILLVLKGGNNSPSRGGSEFGGSGGERYERLPPEERALLSFSTRLKRAPSQVVRYAYGGIPLWSKPLHQPQSSIHKSNQQSKNVYSTPLVVPNCDCGAERVFEFQIMPSVLHVLDVDRYASGSQKSDGLIELISSGGMNWGVIAVYSCPESCEKSREEFVIVQDAVSDAPIRMKAVKMDTTDDDMDD